jgi:hypothetical protein
LTNLSFYIRQCSGAVESKRLEVLMVAFELIKFILILKQTHRRTEKVFEK